MSQVFNIYCDESCHLELDQQPVMVLGALWCPVEQTRAIADHIRNLKASHGLSLAFEIKWTKVSRSKLDFYLALVDYFFNEQDLHFRALIAEKHHLNHAAFPGQDHDDWYYKMLFTLLSPLLSPEAHYRIYLDLKDTQSCIKAAKLHDVLCNARYDFDRQLIERVQPVASHEVQQLQLCDLLIGAITYTNRGLTTNSAKLALIERIKEWSAYSLVRSTLLGEKKLNLFRWQGREACE
jgi:hypothetical protein